MAKITKASLEQLAQEMITLTKEEMRSIVGGTKAVYAPNSATELDPSASLAGLGNDPLSTQIGKQETHTADVLSYKNTEKDSSHKLYELPNTGKNIFEREMNDIEAISTTHNENSSLDTSGFFIGRKDFEYSVHKYTLVPGVGIGGGYNVYGHIWVNESGVLTCSVSVELKTPALQNAGGRVEWACAIEVYANGANVATSYFTPVSGPYITRPGLLPLGTSNVNLHQYGNKKIELRLYTGYNYREFIGGAAVNNITTIYKN